MVGLGVKYPHPTRLWWRLHCISQPMPLRSQKSSAPEAELIRILMLSNMPLKKICTTWSAIERPSRQTFACISLVAARVRISRVLLSSFQRHLDLPKLASDPLLSSAKPLTPVPTFQFFCPSLAGVVLPSVTLSFSPLTAGTTDAGALIELNSILPLSGYDSAKCVCHSLLLYWIQFQLEPGSPRSRKLWLAHLRSVADHPSSYMRWHDRAHPRAGLIPG